MSISESTEITLTDGRTRSTLQAIRAGGAGHIVIMPKETGAAYERHFTSFMDHFQPKGLMETRLVRQMASLQWRMDRASVFENNMLALSEAEHQSSLDSSDAEANTGFKGLAALRSLPQVFATLSTYEQRRINLGLSRKAHTPPYSSTNCLATALYSSLISALTGSSLFHWLLPPVPIHLECGEGVHGRHVRPPSVP